MASNCQFFLAACPRAHSCETSVLFCLRSHSHRTHWTSDAAAMMVIAYLISCSELARNSWRVQAKSTVLSCTLFAVVRNLSIREEEPFSSTRAVAMMMIRYYLAR